MELCLHSTICLNNVSKFTVTITFTEALLCTEIKYRTHCSHTNLHETQISHKFKADDVPFALLRQTLCDEN